MIFARHKYKVLTKKKVYCLFHVKDLRLHNCIII